MTRAEKVEAFMCLLTLAAPCALAGLVLWWLGGGA